MEIWKLSSRSFYQIKHKIYIINWLSYKHRIPMHYKRVCKSHCCFPVTRHVNTRIVQKPVTLITSHRLQQKVKKNNTWLSLPLPSLLVTRGASYRHYIPVGVGERNLQISRVLFIIALGNLTWWPSYTTRQAWADDS